MEQGPEKPGLLFCFAWCCLLSISNIDPVYARKLPGGV